VLPHVNLNLSKQRTLPTVRSHLPSPLAFSSATLQLERGARPYRGFLAISEPTTGDIGEDRSRRKI